MKEAMITIFIFGMLLPTVVSATDYKKEFCDKVAYVGNAPNKYPHLHCGKRTFILSKSKNDHVLFHKKTNCEKANEILTDPSVYASANESADITKALTKYINAGCPQP